MEKQAKQKRPAWLILCWGLLAVWAVVHFLLGGIRGIFLEFPLLAAALIMAFCNVKEKHWGVLAASVLALLVMIGTLFAELYPMIFRPSPLEEVGIQAPDAVCIEKFDCHGGFHGDGESCQIYQLDKKTAHPQMEESPDWKPLPMAEGIEVMLYGKGSFGPYFNSVKLPRIQNGYWYFQDRFDQAEKKNSPEESIQRGAQNVTIALYDSDEERLYIAKLDT